MKAQLEKLTAFVRSRRLGTELLAAMKKDKPVAECIALVHEGADLTRTNFYGEMPVHLFCKTMSANPEFMGLLLGSGSLGSRDESRKSATLLEAKDGDGRTPLLTPVFWMMDQEKCQQLLTLGANLHGLPKMVFPQQKGLPS